MLKKIADILNTYKPGNLVLIKYEQNAKLGTDAYQGPWEIKPLTKAEQ